jgi:3-deoxy-D-manno-octulosonic-acid transferase
MHTLVINGRVSTRMMRRAERAGGFVRWLYRLPTCLCVQSELDAGRLAQLGVPAERVIVAGNTKADGMAERDRALEARLAQEIGVGEGEVWLVAGSTHAGEEQAVVEAFLTIREQLPQARLLLAPRHVERVAEVSAMLAQRGLAVARRSEDAGVPEAVVVLDTMGELRAAYALGAACFVGGTLAPIGGHNPLEPAAVGRAALFGPYTANCADVADLVLEAGVGFRAWDAKELAEEFLRIVRDTDLQERIAREGPALVASQRGAAQRCANIAIALLEEAPGG